MQKVKATFLLSGWGEAEDGAPARHVVRVVEGQQVQTLLIRSCWHGLCRPCMTAQHAVCTA